MERDLVGFECGVVVGVGEHRPFWFSGGPGGVYEGGNVGRESFVAASPDLILDAASGVFAELHEVAPKHRGVVVLVEFDGLYDDYLLQARAVLLSLAGEVVLGAVAGEQDSNRCVVHDVCHLFGR